jgi:hypothetical protein
VNLLAPYALWGLLALALPLALHLRRRRVGRTVQVGSVRHLESLPTAERRGLRLREPWLLLLRAAIVSLVVVLLARPMLERAAREGRVVALVDSAAPPALIDSLGQDATLLVERLDDPWRRVAELDDSLPDGVRLIVAAANSSDRFEGPRPTVARAITWILVAVARPMPTPAMHALRSAPPLSTIESRALRAAAAAVAEEFGPLRDTTGWQDRLPEWWRDSLATTGFPVAAAHALLPVRSSPAPVPLSTAQLLPRQRPAVRGGPAAMDLHWWLWVFALALFTVERFWAFRHRGSV